MALWETVTLTLVEAVGKVVAVAVAEAVTESTVVAAVAEVGAVAAAQEVDVMEVAETVVDAVAVT